MVDAPVTSYSRKKIMPKEMHESLMKSARKKGLKGDRKDAYVYGTMNKKGKLKRNSKQKDRSPRY